MSQRVCLALDLVDDQELISAYEKWHRVGNVPVEIVKSIADFGVENMEIFRAGNRMFMIMDVADNFSENVKAEADSKNPHVQKWGELMKKFQQPIPAAGPDGTWFPMENIYRLTDHIAYYKDKS
ncbi:L-rhamnose mutarotase [Hirschia baltica]|uniref:L-rhamnose mutarotase n=1 Tax=Hirschia baltica (strain ATCC 49814 / DSM 5838 / IFAM 1418) TaxID=582402 RepID=C6XPT9_HIRBI|nr:L-rhamnose mutarotase [Hirschia baltica]ACT60354.1 protein of unknown function DUF718 [Hirschia baltica ATCC 49814]